MKKEEFIDLLNKDLEEEYAAAVQYIQHAAMVTGAKYQSIQKELIVHANEEIMHANQLADLITTLGGVPTAEIGKRFVSDKSEEMLKQDLQGEQSAIARYKKRIEQANQLGEYGIARVLMDILVMEEEHERDLLAALGQ